MGKITPILQRMDENCESLAVSIKTEQAAQVAMNEVRAQMASLSERCRKLELLIQAARRKRARIRRENEALGWYNARGQWRDEPQVVSLKEWRNRSRFSVIKQGNTHNDHHTAA